VRVAAAKEGVSVTALREIKLLKEMHSPHVVSLLDVFPHKRGICLVFEYMDSDLAALAHDRSTVLTPADVKTYVRALLAGLAACHGAGVLHRDVKPDNVLLSADGRVKLADFGLSRGPRACASPRATAAAAATADPSPHGLLPARPLTNAVFARWYRAPELLYGSTLYGPPVDVWAAGCVLAELLLRRPWLPGASDVAQLGLIFGALGTPPPGAWPGVDALPAFVPFSERAPPPLAASFPGAPPDAVDLLARLVALNPAARITAADALAHPFFTRGEPPTPPHALPAPPRRPGDPLAPAAAMTGGGEGGPTGMTGPVRRLGLGGEEGAASRKRRAGADDGTPADAGGGVRPPRPALDSEDRSYLRRRGGDLGAALDGAAAE
jgi:cyclin-dependent kinase 7